MDKTTTWKEGCYNICCRDTLGKMYTQFYLPTSNANMASKQWKTIVYNCITKEFL